MNARIACAISCTHDFLYAFGQHEDPEADFEDLELRLLAYPLNFPSV